MPKNIVIEFSYVKFINSFVYNILSINVCSIPVTTWKQKWILYTLHFIYKQNTTVWCQYVCEKGWRIHWTGWVGTWAFIPLLQPSPYPATSATDAPAALLWKYNSTKTKIMTLILYLLAFTCLQWSNSIFPPVRILIRKYKIIINH